MRREWDPIAALAGHFPALVAPFEPTVGLVRGALTPGERDELAGHRRACGRSGAPKKHAPMEIGRTFGALVAVEIFPPTRTVPERVKVRCAEGHTKTVYTVNARKWTDEKRCAECAERAAYTRMATSARPDAHAEPVARTR